MAIDEVTEIPTPSSPDCSDSDPSSPTAEITVYDIEKGTAPGTTKEKLPFSMNIHQGRPNISELIEATISGTDPKDRIAVGVCGPGDLVDRTREGVSRDVYDNGPSITLYSEVSRESMRLFSWKRPADIEDVGV